MKLSGQATLAAGVDQVYAALNDPAVLVRTIPGCQRLEQVAPDSYRATVMAGVASIKGTFDGDVRLADQDAPHSFTLHASGVGVPGTVVAVARVALAPATGGGTALSYDADVTIGGVVGGVGQRMITGVAHKTAVDFFAAVDRALVAGPSSVSPTPGSVSTSAASVSAASVSAASVSVDERSVAGPASGGVWTAPVPAVDASRQRMRDLMLGAAFGAVVALLGVLVGAIVANW